MSKLTEFFNVPQRQIIETVVGKPAVILEGFAPHDLVTDQWTRPGLNHVSAHAPRLKLRESIARKHRQIRVVWGCAWLATVIAAALFGFSFGTHP